MLVGEFAGSAVQVLDVRLTCVGILFCGNSTNKSVEDFRKKLYVHQTFRKCTVTAVWGKWECCNDSSG